MVRRRWANVTRQKVRPRINAKDANGFWGGFVFIRAIRGDDFQPLITLISISRRRLDSSADQCRQWDQWLERPVNEDAR